MPDLLYSCVKFALWVYLTVLITRIPTIVILAYANTKASFESATSDSKALSWPFHLLIGTVTGVVVDAWFIVSCVWVPDRRAHIFERIAYRDALEIARRTVKESMP